jgi:uncharacterized protein YjdB
MRKIRNIIFVTFITLVNYSCYSPNSLESKNDTGKNILTSNKKEESSTLKPETVKESQSPKKVNTVEIAQKNLNLEVGKNLELNAMVTLETGEKNSAVEWVSGDNSIITVNASGKINALKKGMVTIRAIALQDNKTFAECIVTVIDLESDKATVAQIINPSNINNVFEKENLKLAGIAKYANGSFDSDLLWKSSDESIASVNNDGLVTAIRKGEVTITCISKKDTKIFDNYKLNILERTFPTPIDSVIPSQNTSPSPIVNTNITVNTVKINTINSSIRVGDILTLNALVTMSDNNTNNEINWSSSDESIATITSLGKVTALKNGSVTITGTSIKNSTKKDSLVLNINSNFTWYVKADATGTNTGDSWDNAFKNLEPILDLVENGDQIWIASGTYSSNNPIVLKSGIKIYGGFSGNETSFESRDNNNEVILTGVSNRVIKAENINNVTIDSLTIKGGMIYVDDGGGIYIKKSTNINLNNINFIDNISSYTGGGLFIIASSKITVKNANFSNNRTGEGGSAVGIRDCSSISIIDSEMSENTAENGNGTIWNSNSSPNLSNITIKNNHNNGGNYIVNILGSNPIINNIIATNNN